MGERVERCRSCQQPVVWRKTALGKWCPYDYDEQTQTVGESHFRSCPQAQAWSKKSARRKAVQEEAGA